MFFELRQWPASVYPRELKPFPEAKVDVDVALLALRREGPAPEGYTFKHLGKSKGYLWQINLKVVQSGRQVRILYAPYGRAIVVFHIHKKSSPQEQQAGYALAMSRKREAEKLMKQAGHSHATLPVIDPTVH
jgi:hypothetical protein